MNTAFLESFRSGSKSSSCLIWKQSLTSFENGLTWKAPGYGLVQITETSHWNYICFSSQLLPLPLMCPAPCGHNPCAPSPRILHPSAAHSPRELSIGEGLPGEVRETGKGKYPWDSAAVLYLASPSWIFTLSSLLLILSCLSLSSVWSQRAPSAAHLCKDSVYPASPFCWDFFFLRQSKARGLEGERHNLSVTAEQVILLKPGTRSHFPGWKLPLHSAGFDMAVTGTGEMPSTRQGVSQSNWGEYGT